MDGMGFEAVKSAMYSSERLNDYVSWRNGEDFFCTPSK